MTSNRVADELLKWGLRHTPADGTAPNGEPASIANISADIASGKRPDLADPGLFNAIMGKSEAQMMQEELAVALDTGRSEEDRCTALDNFEMLIEQVDNANNITSMKMWQPLLSLLRDPAPKVQVAAAWIVGTAVQNNDKAQMAILAHHPLPELTDLLEQSPSPEVRSKAMYALSSLLRHNPAAVKQWQDECQGWKRVRSALLDPNMTLRRKTAFLLNGLLLQDDGTTYKSEAPLLIGGPSSDTPAQTSAAPRSASTAIAPMPGSNSTSASTTTTASSHPAPLERGPATIEAGVAHPNVAAGMQSSGLFRTLASSLLPAPSSGEDWEPIEAAGPDGDQEPRADLDYAEKASRTVLTFAERVVDHRLALDAESKALLLRVERELQGPALEATEKRYAEVGIEKEEMEAFSRRVQELTSQ